MLLDHVHSDCLLNVATNTKNKPFSWFGPTLGKTIQDSNREESVFLFICLLLDSYLRQVSCVAWGFLKSRYFSLSNGVKQGGVLSPILFTLYIDKLLSRLNHAHIGCHMNNIFAGALSYADDITLLCPSICGINKMYYN